VSTLEFRGVQVRFGHGRQGIAAVDGVDLVVPSGAVVGLVGESGSGKTTLARSAVGLAPVAAGQVLLDGADISGGGRRAARERRRIQMVFQDPYSALNPRMTVGATVAEAIGAHRRTERRARGAEVERLLDLVGLDPGYAALLPRDLSAGQRQRVGVARALAARPRVVIADEISSALDVSVQGAVLNLVRGLQRELALTMLFISHNLAVVRYVSDLIAVMYLGRIVEVAPVHELIAAPRHPYTRALLESVPRVRLAGPAGDGAADRPSLDQEPPDPHSPPEGCRFHTRCPLGPLIHPERAVCVERDPQVGAKSRPHRSACHFADELQSDGARASGGAC
jgi:peptide/nickel transport system ATP-binding protein